MNKLQNFNKLLHKKKGLLKCIFSTLIMQVLITSAMVYYIYTRKIYVPIDRNPLLFFIIALAILFALIYLMLTVDSFNLKFGIFIVFSLFLGIILGANTQLYSPEIIFAALSSTTSLFTVMLLAGFFIVYLNIDLSWMGVILLMTLIVVIIVRIVYFFTPMTRELHRFLTIVVLVLFSFYILYDTNNILIRYKDTGTDCIRGAMDYYLDLLNIFSSFLNLNN